MMRHSGGACSRREIQKGAISQAFRAKKAGLGRFLGEKGV